VPRCATLCRVVPRCAVPCCAALCCAVPRCAVLCCTVPCCAVLCCTVPRCAALCRAVLHCATLCRTVPRCAVPRCATLCCAMLCRVVPRCAVPCCAALCRAVPHCATLCHAVPCCAVLCRAVPRCAALCHAVPRCAVLCRCRQAEARGSPRAAPEGCAGLAAGTAAVSFDPRCQHKGQQQTVWIPGVCTARTRYAGHPPGEPAVRTCTGERKKFTHVFRKNGTLQWWCLTWPPNHSKWSISTKVAYVIMLVVAEDFLRSWTTSPESHSPRSSPAHSGNASSPSKHVSPLATWFAGSKAAVRCEAELAAPVPGRQLPWHDRAVRGCPLPGGLLSHGDSVLSPLIRDCGHTVILLISSLCCG